MKKEGYQKRTAFFLCIGRYFLGRVGILLWCGNIGEIIFKK